MNIDLTEIIVAVIGLCGVLITGFLVPWIKSKTTTQQQDIISALAKTAVFAAQQIFATDEAVKKKQYAVEYLENMLSAYKITVNLNALDVAVEGALKEIKTEVGENGGVW